MLALRHLSGICLPSVWCPPFPLHTPSLTSFSFSRQHTALAHLDSLPPHDLVLWTDNFVTFPFGKGSSGVLANCSLCGTETILSFSVGSVCSNSSAEVCVILQALTGLDSTNKSAISHLFSQILALFSPSSFLLSQSLWQELSFLFCTINGSPDTCFSRGTK